MTGHPFKPGDVVRETIEPFELGVVITQPTGSLLARDRIWAHWLENDTEWSEPMHANPEDVEPVTGVDADRIFAEYTAWLLTR